jgi:hypothetical protein
MINKILELILKVLNDSVCAALIYNINKVVHIIGKTIEAGIRAVIVLLLSAILLPFIGLAKLFRSLLQNKKFISIRKAL